MAFTLEDGTGVTGANAYTDETFADTYFTDRGEAGWAGTVGVKQQAIIRATDYIDNRWGSRFRGTKLLSTQGLQWPRDVAYDDRGDQLTGVPEQLKKATAEYALRALTATLAPDPSYDASGLVVKRKLEKVGPLEEETEYAGSAPVPIIAYPSADRLLRELIHGGNRVVRA